jgi:long-chain acyl-CoA synthetase
MTFLEAIFDRLQNAAHAPVMCEVRDGGIISVTGNELLAMIQQARKFLGARGLRIGDRCVLIAPNSIRWAALDLAMMAEGVIVVPLYVRQASAELASMMKNAMPARIFCVDASAATEIQKVWPNAPKISLLDSVFAGESGASAPPHAHGATCAVAIIYTSGTSGEPKGVVLTSGNVGHILACTNARLDELMVGSREPERVFHYLYFCFAGSWILLLSALSRNSIVTLSTDLSKLSDEIKIATPHYFLNVPTLLERIRTKIEERFRNQSGFTTRVFTRAQQAYLRRHNNQSQGIDSMWLALANWLIFPTIRKAIGPNLKALICGSAPLAVETQLFFLMIGISVLQVYGLTETTAICTMDEPKRSEPGRVGPAIPGVEMKLAENDEILVRGPNIFWGYWQRPGETEKALDDGWFHTGDQGEMDARGNWRISGRLKNLIILKSGHNIAPEPLEEALEQRLPQASQVMVVGNQRSFLGALVVTASANNAERGAIQAAVDSLNCSLPHYKQIHAFSLIPEPFSIENGLMTTNGKLKRNAIVVRFAAEIEQLYKNKST